MRAVVVTGPRAEDWEERDIENSLEVLQDLVGGYIEPVPTETLAANVLVNDEGKLRAMPPTARWLYNGQVQDVLCGPIVILGPVDASGEYTPLTDEGLEEVRREIVPCGGGVA